MIEFDFFWYDPQGSGDYFYGSVYDDGTYGYGTGQTISGPYARTENSSSDAYYYIYGSNDADNSHYAGEVRTRDYYDGQSGVTLNTYHENAGSVSGWSGLGSEYDWIQNSSGTYDDFGRDWYGANYYSTAYNFYWWDGSGSGDYFYGTVYDDGSYGYAVGQTINGPYSGTENGSSNGYYYIYSSNNAGSGHYVGEVRTLDYYDWQSGLTLNTYNETTGSASGWYGLGSEKDWVQISKGRYDQFGQDWYTVDYKLTAYSFYWWDQHGSGDYFYGTVYDDGSYGYAVGQTLSGPYTSTENHSHDALYYIYSSSSNADADHYVGEVRTHSYYDYVSGETHRTYNSTIQIKASGWYGLGSEYDMLYSLERSPRYDDFGRDYYTANEVRPQFPGG